MPLFILLFSLAALPTQVPLHVTPYGQPKAESQIKAFLEQYCAPIKAWNKSAFSLCIESGGNINKAVIFAKQYDCSELNNMSRAECQYSLALYQNNFRLWQGSVDNIQRAKAYLLALKNKKSKKVHTSAQASRKKIALQPEAAVLQPKAAVLQPNHNKPEQLPAHSNNQNVSGVSLKQEKPVATINSTVKLEVNSPIVAAEQKPDVRAMSQAEQESCLQSLSLWQVKSNISLDVFAMQLLHFKAAIEAEDKLRVASLIRTLRQFHLEAVYDELLPCLDFSAYQQENAIIKKKWAQLKIEKASLVIEAEKILARGFSFSFSLAICAFILVFLLIFCLVYLKKSKK